jgi:hypothetical protein
MNATSDRLIILTHAEYLRLKRELKEAGLDLCYTVQLGAPIRLDWSPRLFEDAAFLRYLTAHRPLDPTYRIASVRHIKKGGWFRPDQFSVSFHAVRTPQDVELQQYLAEHQVKSSAAAPKDMLAVS